MTINYITLLRIYFYVNNWSNLSVGLAKKYYAKPTFMLTYTYISYAILNYLKAHGSGRYAATTKAHWTEWWMNVDTMTCRGRGGAGALDSESRPSVGRRSPPRAGPYSGRSISVRIVPSTQIISTNTYRHWAITLSCYDATLYFKVFTR